nr:hypothetical protein [Tanacetum cinerariifolium]
MTQFGVVTIVLRNEQKLHHLEEALPKAPPATAIAAICNVYTRRVDEQQEVACLMLQAEQELFKTVKAFHACKQEEGQSISTYVLKMKAYLDQMERLGYPMPLVLRVSLIFTSLLSDYDQFVQNYNMHGMEKTIPELHAMLKLVEKSIPKEALAVLVIRQDNGVILVFKDSIFYFNAFLSDGIFEIDMHNHKSNERFIYTCSNKKTKHNLNSTFLWHCHLGHINKKRIAKLQHVGLLASIDDESFDICVSCISGKMARKPFTFASERADDLLGVIHSDECGPFRTTSREGKSHWTAVKNLLKYLRNTKDMFLVYGGDSTTELGVTCYTNDSWETNRDDLQSQIGCNGSYWIRKFNTGLGVVLNIDKPMDMYYDNIGAITIADEPGVQKGAKHFQRTYHFIRKAIQEGDIRIPKVHTDNNLANPFTKPMPCTKHVEHSRSIRLRTAGSFM